MSSSFSRRDALRASAGIATFAIGGKAMAAWPDRPITLIVPYPAGGGTDIVARTLAPIMERELKATINVVNRAGGGGVTGHDAIARAQPDGYTIGMITNDLSFYTHLGQSKLTHRDFTKIGQTNEILGSVTVKEGAPWNTVGELLATIKAQPGKLRGTGAAPGVNWHVGFLGMMDSLKMDPRSAAPSFQPRRLPRHARSLKRRKYARSASWAMRAPNSSPTFLPSKRPPARTGPSPWCTAWADQRDCPPRSPPA
jgi:hypothetical protein